MKEARIALELAARKGRQPPAWVEEILTPAGRAHYREQLLRSATAPTHEALSIAEIRAEQLFVVEAPKRFLFHPDRAQSIGDPGSV